MAVWTDRIIEVAEAKVMESREREQAEKAAGKNIDKVAEKVIEEMVEPRE
jgi:hypothetical protein